MTITAENFLWVEKYRPKTIADCILPEDLKNTFQAVIDSGEPQNMLLAGSAGCGKTTVARALCDQMGLDYIFVNASENGNIDTLRTTIRNFASTVSLEGGFKVVILDEADFLNCLEENEEIVLSNNQKLRLGDMEKDKEYSIISMNPATGEFETDIAELVHTDEKMVYEVVLADGSIVLATEDHRFMVESMDGKIEEASIKSGLSGKKVIKMN